MNTGELYALYLQHPSVQTDTRKLKAGDIFFALRGDNFNGNQFAKQAIDAGAAIAVIDDPAYQIPGKTVLVKDSLESLQQLAKEHRLHFNNRNVPFLAITGSNGKTTTKELIHAVLSTTFKTYTTEGNLNNHIGVPLTILKIRPDADMAVIEMGANHQQEIAGYCRYALPTHGLITNCGKAHLEGFGGVEGVRKGKGELFDHLREHGGTAFVMADDPHLIQMSKGIAHTSSYGTVSLADVRGEVISSDPFLEIRITKGAALERVATQLVGDYNLPNVLAAVAVGKYFKVEEAKIRQAIEAYHPSNSRSQMLEKGSNHIILDAYNANPSSMKLAIENFARLQVKDKVLLLGAMAELGADSEAEHKALVELIRQHDWKEVVLVGKGFDNIIHPWQRFPDAAAAAAWLSGQHYSNTHFLVKGSRSMQMEKVLDAIN